MCRRGHCAQATTAPDQRQGALWDYYRTLQAEGRKPDCSFYSTLVRLHVSRKERSEPRLTKARYLVD